MIFGAAGNWEMNLLFFVTEPQFEMEEIQSIYEVVMELNIDCLKEEEIIVLLELLISCF